MSPTSARGKLVYRGGRVLALLHNLEDLVVLDIGSGQIKCRVAGAGGLGCQEVLYDVSTFNFTQYQLNFQASRYSTPVQDFSSGGQQP